MVNTKSLNKLRKISLYAIELFSINVLLIIWTIDIFAIIFLISEKTEYFKGLYDILAFTYTGQIALLFFSIITVSIPSLRERIFSNNFKSLAFVTMILMVSSGFLNLQNSLSFLVIYVLIPINAPALLMVYASKKLRQNYEEINLSEVYPKISNRTFAIATLFIFSCFAILGFAINPQESSENRHLSDSETHANCTRLKSLTAMYYDRNSEPPYLFSARLWQSCENESLILNKDLLPDNSYYLTKDFSITKENIMIQYCTYIPNVPSKDCQIPGTLNLEKDKHKLYDIIPTYNIKKTYQDPQRKDYFITEGADGESLPNIKNFLYDASSKKQDSAILFQRIAQIGELLNARYPGSLKLNPNYKEPSTDAPGIIDEFTALKYRPDISNLSFSPSYRYAIYFWYRNDLPGKPYYAAFFDLEKNTVEDFYPSQLNIFLSEDKVLFSTSTPNLVDQRRDLKLSIYDLTTKQAKSFDELNTNFMIPIGVQSDPLKIYFISIEPRGKYFGYTFYGLNGQGNLEEIYKLEGEYVNLKIQKASSYNYFLYPLTSGGYPVIIDLELSSGDWQKIFDASEYRDVYTNERFPVLTEDQLGLEFVNKSLLFYWEYAFDTDTKNFIKLPEAFYWMTFRTRENLDSL